MKKDVSRREFARNLTKLLLFGGLTHFALPNAIGADIAESLITPICPGGRIDNDLCVISVNEKGKHTETDMCPGGGPLEDVCDPEAGLYDECPGEQMPEDECSPSGARRYENGIADDECNSGNAISDICAPVILPSRDKNGKVQNKPNGEIKMVSSDQCISGVPLADECPEGGVDDTITDICHSGLAYQDCCELNLVDRKEVGDNCPGGIASADQCEEDIGDVCNPNEEFIDESDACKSSLSVFIEDTCGVQGHPDKCPNGTNTYAGLGDDDMCGDRTLPIVGYAGYASDDCHDGSAEQDICQGSQDNREGRDEDVCLPSGKGELGTEDKCEPAVILEDKDVCYHGMQESDKCQPYMGDEDECPGGGYDVDECYTGMSWEDECPGGRSDVDVCISWSPETDECDMLMAVSGHDNETQEKCNAEDFVE